MCASSSAPFPSCCGARARSESPPAGRGHPRSLEAPGVRGPGRRRAGAAPRAPGTVAAPRRADRARARGAARRPGPGHRPLRRRQGLAGRDAGRRHAAGDRHPGTRRAQDAAGARPRQPARPRRGARLRGLVRRHQRGVAPAGPEPGRQLRPRARPPGPARSDRGLRARAGVGHVGPARAHPAGRRAVGQRARVRAGRRSAPGLGPAPPLVGPRGRQPPRPLDVRAAHLSRQLPGRAGAARPRAPRLGAPRSDGARFLGAARAPRPRRHAGLGDRRGRPGGGRGDLAGSVVGARRLGRGRRARVGEGAGAAPARGARPPARRPRSRSCSPPRGGGPCSASRRD